MATVTSFGDGIQVPHSADNQSVWQEMELDFAATNVATAATVNLIPVATNQHVLDFIVNVATVTGATATASFGDSSDIDGYDANVNLNSAGISRTTNGTDAYGKSKIYTGTGRILMRPSVRLTAGVIRVMALVRDMQTM